MHNTATRTESGDTAPDATGAPASAGPAGEAAGPAGDPRLRWSSTDDRPAVPVLRFRRDGILPTVAAALSVRGETLTGTAGKADQPPALHPLVQDFLDTLTSGQRERFTGRCPEAILLSRHLTAVEGARSRRASRKPLSASEARRSLKHAKITARHIREDGDPLHDSYAPPCRSCDALLAHFGVRPVDLTPLRVAMTAASASYDRSSATRFPVAVDSALRTAGWEPGRWDIKQAEYWADALRDHTTPAGHRHTVFPAAVEAWAEFGGLTVAAHGPGRQISPTPVRIDPLTGLHLARTFADLGRALSTQLCPLGVEADGGSHLAIDREGRTYGIDHTGDWYLGPTVDEALTLLLTGLQPTRLTT